MTINLKNFFKLEGYNIRIPVYMAYEVIRKAKLTNCKRSIITDSFANANLILSHELGLLNDS